MNRRTWSLFVCLALWAASAPAQQPPPTPAAPEPARVHQPGEQLERAVTDVVLACLREQPAEAFEAMGRLDGACRKLSATDDPPPVHGVLVYDQALHSALEKSRQLVRSKHVTEAFDQFVWVMRACRQCHEMARREGKGPLPGSGTIETPAAKSDGAPAGSRLR